MTPTEVVHRFTHTQNTVIVEFEVAVDDAVFISDNVHIYRFFCITLSVSCVLFDVIELVDVHHIHRRCGVSVGGWLIISLVGL